MKPRIVKNIVKEKDVVVMGKKRAEGGLVTEADLKAFMVDSFCFHYELPRGEEMEKHEYIQIKYHDPDIKIEGIELGDWIDLRSSINHVMQARTYAVIPLGVSMKLPEGYEAHIAPRSTTFEKWGIIMVNSVGVIDNSFSGNGDIWAFKAYAVRDTVIQKGDRICQFRIMKKQPKIIFQEVDDLGDNNRGSGVTGRN
jgi:dUTP pyrophosphatase